MSARGLPQLVKFCTSADLSLLYTSRWMSQWFHTCLWTTKDVLNSFLGPAGRGWAQYPNTEEPDSPLQIWLAL